MSQIQFFIYNINFKVQITCLVILKYLICEFSTTFRMQCVGIISYHGYHNVLKLNSKKTLCTVQMFLDVTKQLSLENLTFFDSIILLAWSPNSAKSLRNIWFTHWACFNFLFYKWLWASEHLTLWLLSSTDLRVRCFRTSTIWTEHFFFWQHRRLKTSCTRSQSPKVEILDASWWMV